ncbi:hypothetical protein BKG71_06640 [Mycobacteroides chelonae]|uniref:Uncharacterized protein n=1 Tax=Mycobacteroides chelonae TaxID=1774 RepID=A0AB73LGB8_MYCCH|nr:hypothetical protein BKG62_13940 [Mycobacteroides chelonae]OHT53094.1 hypothetical protein BKG63_14165 [Mycobacteroides chelonae]OHT61044.1 hypothetical protein BKG65_21915 [Mycobacteroides chelonae]OHT63585.1 hypothetical protein BKG64_07005 [Mycobacteroides chelonae]OHT74911.1 hypothetical protein BKG66_01455 [Mycobacteroides chelonae]
MPGVSSVNGSSSAQASVAPIAILTAYWCGGACVRPSGPANGDAATANATRATTASSTRRRARRSVQAGGAALHSASSMPATNHEKKAGGHVNGLTPTVVWKGMNAHPRLAAPAITSTGARQRSGTRRMMSAMTGSAM